MEERIQLVCNCFQIDPKELEYDWNGLNESFSTTLFQLFHLQLKNAILENIIKNNQAPNDNIKKCVKRILDWGGIKHVTVLLDKCSLFIMEIEKAIRNGQTDSAFQFDNKTRAFNVNIPVIPLIEDKLSSWTKILAAYDPNRFWIYDTRVAIALCFLDPFEWFVPGNGGRENRIGGVLKSSNIGNQKESYAEYLALLKNEQIAPWTRGHYEKQLFMLGGILEERLGQFTAPKPPVRRNQVEGPDR